MRHKAFETYEHKNIEILKQHYCSEPIYRMHLMPSQATLCCSAWTSVYLPDWQIPSKNKQLLTLRDLWFSKEAEILRKSVIDDRDFKYCHNTMCPYIQTPEQKMLDNEQTRSWVEKWRNREFFIPILSFDVDLSCQLRCPSCRTKVIYHKDILKESPPIYNITQETLKLFDEGNIQYLNMNSAGDPFISPACIYLMDNITGIENFSEVHLHTNGMKFTESWWDSHPKMQKMVKHLQLSLDAGTEECYDKVRVGGNFKKVIENCEFISTLKEIDTTINIVVQKDNYKSLPEFLEYGKRWGFHINASKILHWDQAMTMEQWEDKAVWKPKHPEHSEFIEVIEKLPPLRDYRISFGPMVAYLSQFRSDMK